MHAGHTDAATSRRLLITVSALVPAGCMADTVQQQQPAQQRRWVQCCPLDADPGEKGAGSHRP